MSADLTAFAVGFATFWGLLAAYLAYLHVAQTRLAREVRDLRSRLEDAKGKFK